jgi:streptogramin lyase
VVEKPRISAHRARPPAIATLAATAAVLFAPVHVAAAPNGYDVVTEFATSPVSSPVGIITGPDGKIWYTAGNTDAVVQVDPATGATLQTVSLTFGTPGCNPIGLTIGPDRNLWTACFGLDYLVRVTTAGVATRYLLGAGSAPWALTPGTDGGLWFTEEGTGKIGRLDMTSFAIYEYSLPSGAAAQPRGIVAGNGNIYVAESATSRIGCLCPRGLVEFTVPTANSSPFDMTLGPDSYIYFTESVGDRIGKMTWDGSIVEYPVPTVSSSPHEITAGPDGNLWFTYFGNKIGSITADGFHTPGGILQDFSLSTINSHPFGITLGPDGNIWFAESGGFKIGKVGARHNALVLDRTGIGFANVPSGTTTAPQRLTVYNTGPDSLPGLTLTFDDGTYPSGFAIADTTCTAPVAAGSSCVVDLQFNSVPAYNPADTLVIKTGVGSPVQQKLSVELRAYVVAHACNSTAIHTDLASPQNVAAVVTLSATVSGCTDASPFYQFQLRSPEGVWSVVQDFSTSSSFVWNTAAFEAGTYLTGVWVKDSQSTLPYDTYANGTFTLAVPNCMSTNMSSDIASPQAVGATVTFTATSAGCPAPLYQWWVRDSSGIWAVVIGHDFAHSSSTLAWNTGALTEGTYQVGVWAKQPGSTASYDAFAIITYTLTVIHCSAVNLATSVTSPQPTQSSIVLMPAATACPSPVYRFYVRDNTGVWHVAQDFGVGNTFTWNSTSPPVNTYVAGTYLLGVWARQPGSVNSYDAFAFITFSLTAGSTCTVNISSSMTSPQTVGTAATWTGTANGCPNTPLGYQFWINPPGGSWTIVQPFSSTNSFAWTGATAGTYQVGIWIKQAGSTSAYDNFALTTFTLTPTSPAQVCQSVSVGAAPPSPSPVGTTITFTASGATGCSTPRYRWWVRDQNGTWFLQQDYDVAGNTFTWSTAGGASTWLVGVWARQSGSTASYEAYSFVTYSLTVPAPQRCTSTSISPSLGSPQPPGPSIMFTATSLGCSSPEYRWWVRTLYLYWGLAQDYSMPGSSFTWPTNLTPGIYLVGVWARQAGSLANYESFAIISFQVRPNATPCTSLTIWPTNGSAANDITSQPPQPVGTTLVVRAQAGGCASPEFEFIWTADFLTFNRIQPFGPASSLTWNTAGLPRGPYFVLVSARQPRSVGDNVFTLMSYMLG